MGPYGAHWAHGPHGPMFDPLGQYGDFWAHGPHGPRWALMGNVGPYWHFWLMLGPFWIHILDHMSPLWANNGGGTNIDRETVRLVNKLEGAIYYNFIIEIKFSKPPIQPNPQTHTPSTHHLFTWLAKPTGGGSCFLPRHIN